MKPKKSLGQNFLKSKQAIFDIVHASEISPGETVLEVGPGKGVLTEALLEAGAKVVAIEADRELIPFLEEKFAKEISEKKLKLVQGDILEFSPEKGDYKIVANIPYYITGAIIRKFLEEKNQPKAMTLLVQKEVAERIVARDEKESILSLSVKSYGEPKYIKKVPARYFNPEPKVDSAIIKISSVNKDKFKNLSEKDFFLLVKTAFGQKRKTLAKNISSLFPREKIMEIFSILGLDEKIRPEDVSLDDFFKLGVSLFPQKGKQK